jgi:selenocysteine-specific elongation factor
MPIDHPPLSPHERKLLAALRRLHAAQPLQPDHRLDAVRAAVRGTPTARSPRHRGGTAVPLDDAAFDAALDALVASGRVRRLGRRLSLAGERPTLGPEMRGRVDALLAELRAAGAAPPRVEGAARRLGIPPAVLEGLRSAGELVALAPGIDYPADLLADLERRLRAPTTGRLTRTAIVDQLGVSRRYADALLAHLSRDRRAVR